MITVIYHVLGPELHTFPYIISYLAHNESVRERLSPFHAVETRTHVGTELGSVPMEVQGTPTLLFLSSEPEFPFTLCTISWKKSLETGRASCEWGSKHFQGAPWSVAREPDRRRDLLATGQGTCGSRIWPEP